MNGFFKNLMNELNSYGMFAGKFNDDNTLEKELSKEIKLRKNVNSQHVWNSYYIPIAAAEIIKKQGTLTKQDEFKLECLANSLMFKDLADGKLTEFYRFKESEV
jgi:hypothetical protein